MSGARRAALRQGLATAGAALGAGVLRLHEPFLSVLAAQLVAGLPCPTPGGWVRRVVAGLIGTAAGLIILSGFPQQPWLAWPAFGAVAACGGVAISRHWEPACVILFGMGVCSSFPAGAIFPVPAVLGGIEHAGSLTIAIASCWLARSLAGEAQEPQAAARPLPSSSALAIGATVVASLAAAGLLLPHELVVMSVASVATIVALEAPGVPAHLPARAAGAAIGMALSIAFIIFVSGAGNNIALFLLSLGLGMAAIEGLATSRPHWAPSLRQAGAVFAVMATMMPGPDISLLAAADRAAAVFIGLALAAGVHAATARKAVAC